MKKAGSLFLLSAIMLFMSFSSNPKSDSLIWNGKIQTIFQTRCYQCHSSPYSYYPFGGFLNTYDSVMVRINDGSLRDHLFVKKDMPPRQNLNDSFLQSDLKMLDSWMNAGAPF